MTHVSPVPIGSKHGSQPNWGGPRAGTIVPAVLPSKIIGSVPLKNIQWFLKNIGRCWLTRSSGIGESAYGFGFFSWETDEEGVETFVTEFFEEVFDVGTRETVEGFES